MHSGFCPNAASEPPRSLPDATSAAPTWARAVGSDSHRTATGQRADSRLAGARGAATTLTPSTIVALLKSDTSRHGRRVTDADRRPARRRFPSTLAAAMAAAPRLLDRTDTRRGCVATSGVVRVALITRGSDYWRYEMALMLMGFEVGDYDEWKRLFDSDPG